MAEEWLTTAEAAVLSFPDVAHDDHRFKDLDQIPDSNLY
jgi:hypothetical protein